tara:strand:+ start:173 stop:424 length:252 start_codon:yes stop_codon:yes gene_type:complete
MPVDIRVIVVSFFTFISSLDELMIGILCIVLGISLFIAVMYLDMRYKYDKTTRNRTNDLKGLGNYLFLVAIIEIIFFALISIS